MARTKKISARERTRREEQRARDTEYRTARKIKAYLLRAAQG